MIKSLRTPVRGMRAWMSLRNGPVVSVAVWVRIYVRDIDWHWAWEVGGGWYFGGIGKCEMRNMAKTLSTINDNRVKRMWMPFKPTSNRQRRPTNPIVGIKNYKHAPHYNAIRFCSSSTWLPLPSCRLLRWPHFFPFSHLRQLFTIAHKLSMGRVLVLGRTQKESEGARTQQELLSLFPRFSQDCAFK